MNPTPAASITIRFATVDDVPLILSFIRGLADYEKLLDAVKATEEMLRETLFGAKPAAEVLIAEDNGKPVGFALFFENYSTFLAQRGIYLEDLFVIPEARGRGVGRVLLQRLAALALERDCGRLEWAVLDWNAPAIGFYKRMGAVPMDDWTVNRLTGPALERMARGEQVPGHAGRHESSNAATFLCERESSLRRRPTMARPADFTAACRPLCTLLRRWRCQRPAVRNRAL